MISGIQFYENGMPIIMQMEEIMLKLSEFCHNHHPSGVKMLAKIYSTWIFGNIPAMGAKTKPRHGKRIPKRG
jgi:hypothetical protein